MSVAAVLLLTAVVWAISLIRSVPMRAFVYSLPLPMTLALLTTDFAVDGAQVLGVVGLNLFFLTVTVLHRHLGWHILVSDLLGIAVYVGLSAMLLLAAPVPTVPALVGVVGLWLAVMLVLRRRAAFRSGDSVASPSDVASPSGAVASPGEIPTIDAAPDVAEAPRRGLPALAKLLVIFVGAILTTIFGQLLQGMVVTFPYSGVLVAVETRRNLTEFSRHFARNSIALVAFTAGYYWLRDSPEPVALAGAWGAFAVTAFVLQLPRLRAALTAARKASIPGGPARPPAADRRSTVRPSVDQRPTGRPYVERPTVDRRAARPAGDRLVPRKAPGGR